MPVTSWIARLLPSRRDGPDEVLAGPIRGDLLGHEHLVQRAQAVARGQQLAPRRRGGRRPKLLARLDDTRRVIASAHSRLVGTTSETDIGPAGAWLLDNFHVVEQHIREVEASLPRNYYAELPELATGPLAEYPRVYELAITLISHTEGRLDLENIESFIEAFQHEVALSIGELWAVPAMLRLGLLESVRRTTLRTVERLGEVESADRWVVRLLAAEADGPDALRAALRDFTDSSPGLTPSFVAHLLQQLRHAGHEPQTFARLEAWIAEQGASGEDAEALATQRLGLTQLIMANSILSLRAIGRLDWRALVERQSAIEAILRDDPAAIHAQMTFATRDRYRHVVERVARRTQRSEEEVARTTLALARDAAATHPEAPWRAHIGYFLVDDGFETLAQATGYRRGPRERLHHLVCRHPNVVFGGGIALGTAAALAALFALAGPVAGDAWALVALVAFLPALDIAVHAVNQLVTTFLPPRILPKLDLRTAGIPAHLRTAVVIPTLFDNVAAVHEALENVEVQFLANRGEHLHFAVLSDFTDAVAEVMPTDDAILRAAVTGIDALNARYAPKHRDAFYLFHRPRQWNASQGTWMGWERKRGKLGEFNRFVRGGAAAAFSTTVGNLTPLRGIRYVITLDADTMLPAEAAPLLIGTIAHPLNQAVFDATTSRVVRGYGVLQPRVSVSLPSAHQTPFAKIHSGHPGVDPYTTAVSDVYQDLYGEGSYTGKGIYDLDVFEQATGGRFPENTLLSHDLIEGNYARAGLVTDITLHDDYPARYATHSRRKHRWIRGDWQLVGWLRRRVPGPAGPQRNRLSLLSRWKLLDNLRRSTTEIAQLAFLIAGWWLVPGSPLRWTALALAAVAAPWIIGFLLAALRPPRDASWRAYYTAIGRDLRVSAQQVGLAVAFLPHQAWVSVDAIVRTWYRLGVSRRQLLEWQAAAQAAHSDLLRPQTTWRLMRPAVVLTAMLAVVAMLPGVHGPDTLPPWRQALAALPILALWGAAPLLARFLSAPVRRGPRLALSLQAQAARYARYHWAYFERFATAETHWLIPDNFQDDPLPVVAMRTSPTNIGLQLLATVSARDLGFLSTGEMVERLEAIFASMDRMDRLRGHFFNWYDLHDLRVLAPAYVSTVDSGNLAGHLIALRQACLGLQDGTELDARLASLAERAYTFAMAMDFSFLYDPRRKLLAIGYQHETHTLDESYYDLLASEARLASFIAIAKRDLPVEHWFRLDRTLTRTDGETALISWSGSMFEYLMPTLVMRTYPSTLLDQTCRAAVQRHIRHGAAHDVPWGVSESAYNVRDRHLTYQYRAFGVPDLALKRGLGRDLVIAPYASILAMQVEPERALANLDRLESAKTLGPYGFRDAIDFTRPDPDGSGAVVATVMAHHAGMSLVALTNTLTAEIWQRRFHDDALVRAAELLLHERIPRRFLLQAPQAQPTPTARSTPEAARPVVREVVDPVGAASRIAMLGRAPYTVMVSSAGGGPSQFEDIAVTRWRPDATADDTGQFCYVRNVTAGRTWSVAHQPTGVAADAHRVVLANDRATFERVDGDIETRTEVVVVPEDAAEVRRVTVTNTGATTQTVELTSYGEIVMARQSADRAHPAFSNLFVETEWHDWCSAITATRRPRSEGERRLWCVHVVDTAAARGHEVSCETERARFLGRGRSVRDPIAVETSGPLSGTTGSVLDPIFALRVSVRLQPGESTTITFTTLVATTRDRALEMADRYHDVHAAQRALDLAAMSTQAELRDLAMTPADAALFQDVAAHLVRGTAMLRAPQEEGQLNRGGQPMLWAQGISGDHPIVLATIAGDVGLPTLRQLLAAHRFWRLRGMTVDLVVLNTRATGYLLDLDHAISAGIFAEGETAVRDQPGGVFVRRQDQLGKDELLMLRASARIVVPCDGRALEAWLHVQSGDAATTPVREIERRATVRLGTDMLSPRAAHALRWLRTPKPAPVPDVEGDATSIIGVESTTPPQVMPALRFDNGIGGVTAEGDYLMRLQGDELPPAPWANVVANPHGGFIVTERGGGNTWSGNSHFYRLTPWHNDPVTDPCGEAIYLRDESSGAVWSTTPGPRDSGASHQVRHGAGFSAFTQVHRGLRAVTTLGMVPDAPIKVTRLALTNTSDVHRRITVTAYAEWTLGALREHARHHIATRFLPGHGAMVAHNAFDPQFADRVAFHALDTHVTAHTGDRTEFLGRQGFTGDPVALRHGAPSLRGTTGVGHDPCSALQCEIELAPGESRELVVLLGTAQGDEEVMAVLTHHRAPGVAAAALAASIEAWEARLSVIRVTTPEPSFDAMVNQWTLYQALSCRMWARSAVYQSGGAYGFRDQLQDVMAFVYAEPGIAREHILRAAARQFVEGDVQHWWHPESGRGTRTRFSDDLVWLPYVVDHYLRVTGDTSILDATAPFLVMRELAPGEQEIYDAPAGNAAEASIHEHCLRVLRRACTVGPHGLPLIGCGDWNDGMSDVGIEGRGESIWLAWFLIATLRGYAEHAADRGEHEVVTELTDRANAYVEAVEREGWDGAWYRRAYFDDGTPLGSRENAECMIDAIAQSWSVLSGAGAPARQVQAMDSLATHLVRDEPRVIALLTPPFDTAPLNPGYIKGYLPGVRENGAQYTHAALWAVLAAAKSGEGDRAFEWFQYLNPLTHTDTPDGVATYKVEPYVVAADVYTAAGHLGRGGWTWYTGAASWMYRTALEGILGFTKRGTTLTLAPQVPDDWREFQIDYRYGSSTYRIEVQLPERTAGLEMSITVDGVARDDGMIALVDDGGVHQVVCRRGSTRSSVGSGT